MFLGISLLFIIFENSIPIAKNDAKTTKDTPTSPVEPRLSSEQTFAIEEEKNTLHVFDDFFCEYCKENFYQALLPLKESPLLTTENIEVVFHTVSKEKEASLPLAKASICTKEQEKEWEFREKVFATNTKTEQEIRNILAEIEMNMTEFENCYTSEITLSQAEKSYTIAQEKGVLATPTILFGKKRLEGASPKENIERLLRK